MSESDERPSEETIGQRLRRLRTERRLSQRQLSSPGVSYAYISRIEAGTRQPSVKALRKLARKLSVSPAYLETGSEIGDIERREMRLADVELELRLTNDPPAAEEKFRALLAEALDAGDVPAATRARIGLGYAAAAAGRPHEAAEQLGQAIEAGGLSPASRPDVYAKLGRAYSELGDPLRAVDLFERCLAEVEEDGPTGIAARVRFATYLSYALCDAGDLDRAAEVMADVVDAHGELADPYTRVKLYWSMARLSGMRGEYNVSLDHARRAVALLEATEDTVQLGRAHLLCGVIMVRRGDTEEARRRLGLAEQLFGPTPDPHDLGMVRTEQARVALMVGDAREAAAKARQALEMLAETDPSERGSAWLALAEALALEDESAAAIEAFRRATDAFEDAGRFHEGAEAYRAWARLLRDAGRESEALDVLERATELAARSSVPATRAAR